MEQSVFLPQICLFIEKKIVYIYNYLRLGKISLLIFIQCRQVSNRYLISSGNATVDKNYPYHLGYGLNIIFMTRWNFLLILKIFSAKKGNL